MAKNKREVQAELEAANKCIAELSQSNQNANSNCKILSLRFPYFRLPF